MQERIWRQLRETTTNRWFEDLDSMLSGSAALSRCAGLGAVPSAHKGWRPATVEVQETALRLARLAFGNHGQLMGECVRSSSAYPSFWRFGPGMLLQHLLSRLTIRLPPAMTLGGAGAPRLGGFELDSDKKLFTRLQYYPSEWPTFRRWRGREVVKPHERRGNKKDRRM